MYSATRSADGPVSDRFRAFDAHDSPGLHRSMARVARSCLGALVLGAALVAAPAQAALRVLACEPEWGALVRELAGQRADLFVATGPLQDPHRIQARPSLIARARNADMLVCTGAGLEVGWLPILLQQSANARIQPGQPGNFAAASYVKLLDVPVRVDRAEGDVHPEGNPHLHLDPGNVAQVASALAQRLAQVDPEGRGEYERRFADFDARWRAALVRWKQQAAPLAGMPVVVQHDSWPYLSAWLGLKKAVTLEPKPGVEPSAGHLQQVLASLKTNPARMILVATYQDPRASQWLAERADMPVVSLPFTVGATSGATDLFGLFDDMIARLLQGAAR